MLEFSGVQHRQLSAILLVYSGLFFYLLYACQIVFFVDLCVLVISTPTSHSMAFLMVISGRRKQLCYTEPVKGAQISSRDQNSQSTGRMMSWSSATTRIHQLRERPAGAGRVFDVFVAPTTMTLSSL
ncbi:hypothetical protein ASPBRDRAFT_612422 [Aspergillus brasiliensis CBS 101740]|uniref:Uncharacterized protein n=1 Tax=Aspergillus brasiliensis (strain CBS 101740 / IMI 381727 / IBT 21946) TaxID=767769 RepID=A0A1L9UI91_ASPBC|nr:hypothetical protein ASPBRDRAFT_612422 [Aspergillus brasiliensis CBS 101740]